MTTTKSHLFVSTFTIDNTSEQVIEHQTLHERLSELQRNLPCVWRAVRVMVFLIAFAVVGLGYSTVFIPYWPQNMQQFVMFLPVKAHCALGLASLSCGVFFCALGLLYNRELAALRLQCERLAGEMPGSADANIIPLPVGPSAKNDWKEASALLPEAA
jgi:hypothetical protein